MKPFKGRLCCRIIDEKSRRTNEEFASNSLVVRLIRQSVLDLEIKIRQSNLYKYNDVLDDSLESIGESKY